jgi:proline dehydrogenase
MEMDSGSLEAAAAAALRHIARDEGLKAYVQQNPPLYQVLLRAAMRFIGGETLSECVATAQRINQQGHAVTIDYMGESTRDQATADQATAEFLRVIEAIQAQQLNASVSYDLSHIGLALDFDLALHNATRLASAAHAGGLEMMISMEGSERTDQILAIHEQLGRQFDNIGITLQVYLQRTAPDLAAALERPGRIRLVKGAYEEPAAIALPRGVEIDNAYRQAMARLISSGHPCSISTHDRAMLESAAGFIEEKGPNHDQVEFEMLQGVTPDLLEMMRERGYNTRVYLPYGQEWYLYLCHRIAEYPPNLYQALADAVGIAALQEGL